MSTFFHHAEPVLPSISGVSTHEAVFCSRRERFSVRARSIARILAVPGMLTALFLIFSGCEHNPDNPVSGKGNVTLTVDWTNKGTGVEAPPSYEAMYTPSSGDTQKFINLSGISNEISISPGEGQLMVYALPAELKVKGTVAGITPVDGLIPSLPGWFFCWAGRLDIESGANTEKTANMKQQMRELDMSILVEPPEFSSEISRITATLSGVASEIDMTDGAVSSAASTVFDFSLTGNLATAKIRLLGMTGTPEQTLSVVIELSQEQRTIVAYDISSLLTNFNIAKTTPVKIMANLQAGAPDNAVSLCRWKHGSHNLSFSAYPLELEFGGDDGSVGEITVISPDRPWNYEVVQTGEWCIVEKAGDLLRVRATHNTGAPREARINIYSDDDDELVTVFQEADSTISYYRDCEVVKLQSATAFGANGKGVNLVIMGDGYVREDMQQLAVGKYEADMRATMDHFFSVYPYNEYRDYFNVHMVAAISNESGISVANPPSARDTRFESLWEGPETGTGINSNIDIVKSYIASIEDLQDVPPGHLTVILPINADIYAGTCVMYPDGFSVSLCPVGSEFFKIVMHEAGGHGFAKLADEYVYFGETTIPASEITTITTWKSLGYMANIDLAGDISATSWSGFNVPKYTTGFPEISRVGAFEGAFQYGRGVWRAEYNSCMNNNIPYFNAPSRWAIVKRISDICGLGITFEAYIASEVIPAHPIDMDHTRDAKAFVPLGRPVLMQ